MDATTLNTLDWPTVLEAFAECAYTTLGAESIRHLAPLNDVHAVQLAFDQIDELIALENEGERIPIGGIEDISELLKRSAKGEVLDGTELRQAGQSMGALRSLAWFLVSHQEETPHLGQLGTLIIVDDLVADELDVAFEPNGTLSGRTYPILAELRAKVSGLHDAIRSTLDSLLRADDMQDLLQDRFVTLRNERYVLPIKSHAKRWDIGIIHGTSGSGQTAYIEPKEVVALNNKLRIAQGDLAGEEAKIRARLSRSLGSCADDLQHALGQVCTIDVACARHRLAKQLNATRPVVSTAQTIALVQARHPVLCLRGIEVVPNDLALNETQAGLLLTGPNAGGKTISLKTIGLCALLVQMGCFLPAEEGSRMDLFPTILAAIGDAQTVHEDLSSFSGHLLRLQEMLTASRPGALLLLDEIASGTDPAQGAPLAQAVLETLVDTGSTVVVTTHFSRLKSLATVDTRFGGAAMEYLDGHPTYRVLDGALGESRALSTAERMGMSAEVIHRARTLMDHGEGAFATALDALEEKRSEAEEAKRTAQHQAKSLAERERTVARRELVLKQRAEELEQKAAATFLNRLKNAEKTISAVVADLQRNPSHARVKSAKAALKGLEGLGTLKQPQTPPKPEPFTPQVGARAFVTNLGSDGEIVSIQGNSVRIKLGTLTTTVKRTQLQKARSKAPETKPSKPWSSKKKKKRTPSKNGQPLEQALRVPANTLDMRGMRVDEGIEKIEHFLDRCLMTHHDYAFLLHGHGTGALKQAIRQWLPSSPHVHRWAAANEDQGGDAFTVVALHS